MNWLQLLQWKVQLSSLFAGTGPIAAYYGIAAAIVLGALAFGYFFAPYRKYVIMFLAVVALSVGSFAAGEHLGAKRVKIKTVVIQKEIDRVVNKVVNDVVAIPPGKRVRDDPYNRREY